MKNWTPWSYSIDKTHSIYRSMLINNKLLFHLLLLNNSIADLSRSRTSTKTQLIQLIQFTCCKIRANSFTSGNTKGKWDPYAIILVRSSRSNANAQWIRFTERRTQSLVFTQKTFHQSNAIARQSSRIGATAPSTTTTKYIFNRHM